MAKVKNLFKNIWQSISEFIRCKLSVWIGKGFKFIGKYTGISFLLRKYRASVSNKGKKAVAGYLFISLWIIGFVIFAASPIVESIRMALSTFTGPRGIGEGDAATTAIVIEGFGFSQFTQIFKDNPDHVEAILSRHSRCAPCQWLKLKVSDQV